MENAFMRKFLQNLLLVALMFMPWVTMSQSFNFSCDFEDVADTAAWDYVNGDYVNQWCIGSGNYNGSGTQSMYISYDGGETNDYYNEEADLYAYRTLNLPAAGNYEYSYDWVATGYSELEYLRVALVPATTTFPVSATDITDVSLPSGWIALDGGHELCDTYEWLTQSGTVIVPTAGEYKLLFFWRNSDYGYYQPAAIDNISLT